MNGKGDKRRPIEVSKEQYDKNWDKIFKKNKNGRISISKKVGGKRQVRSI